MHAASCCLRTQIDSPTVAYNHDRTSYQSTHEPSALPLEIPQASSAGVVYLCGGLRILSSALQTHSIYTVTFRIYQLYITPSSLLQQLLPTYQLSTQKWPHRYKARPLSQPQSLVSPAPSAGASSCSRRYGRITDANQQKASPRQCFLPPISPPLPFPAAETSRFLLWALSGIPFALYALLQNLNLPLQIQPQIFTLLSLVTFAQVLHYTHHYRPVTAILIILTLAAGFAALETGLILHLRPRYNAKSVLVIGVVAAVMLTAGLLPPYWEMWKRGGEVKGINWVFLGLDASGAVLSLASVGCEKVWDPLAAAMYAGVLGLEVGIFTAGAVWWGREWLRKRRGRKVVEGRKSVTELEEGVLRAETGLGERVLRVETWTVGSEGKIQQKEHPCLQM